MTKCKHCGLSLNKPPTHKVSLDLLRKLPMPVLMCRFDHYWTNIQHYDWYYTELIKILTVLQEIANAGSCWGSCWGLSGVK